MPMNHQTMPINQTYFADTTTGANIDTVNPTIVTINNGTEHLPDDVINQMIDSLGDNQPKEAESTFNNIETANISEILNFLN